MKKLLLLVSSVILTTGMLFAQKTEKRAVSDFSGIEASSAFDITVKKGDVTSVVITADEDKMPFVKTKVESGILKLYVDGSNKEITTLKADITVKQLNKIKLSGACKLVLDENDVINEDEIDIDLSGASYTKLRFSGNKLAFDATGASKAEINASVKQASSAAVSGASSAIFQISNTEFAKFRASGASKQIVTGTVDIADFEISGASRITAKTLTVNRAKVNASGASSLNDIEVKYDLKVTASGASDVSYKGTPQTQINASGASSIKSKK